LSSRGSESNTVNGKRDRKSDDDAEEACPVMPACHLSDIRPRPTDRKFAASSYHRWTEAKTSRPTASA